MLCILETIGINQEELVTMDCKSLNRLIKSKKVSKDQAKEIKELRRRYLNRGYANSSRVKKDAESLNLAEENRKWDAKIQIVREIIKKDMELKDTLTQKIQVNEKLYEEDLNRLLMFDPYFDYNKDSDDSEHSSKEDLKCESRNETIVKPKKKKKN